MGKLLCRLRFHKWQRGVTGYVARCARCGKTRSVDPCYWEYDPY